MVDRDVVQRFADVVGVGLMSTVPREQDGCQNSHRWRCTKTSEVRDLIAAFMPYLGERRRTKALEILEATKDCRGAASERTHCPRGHAYDAVNTFRSNAKGGRGCRTCRDRRQAKTT